MFHLQKNKNSLIISLKYSLLAVSTTITNSPEWSSLMKKLSLLIAVFTISSAFAVEYNCSLDQSRPYGHTNTSISIESQVFNPEQGKIGVGVGSVGVIFADKTGYSTVLTVLDTDLYLHYSVCLRDYSLVTASETMSSFVYCSKMQSLEKLNPDSYPEKIEFKFPWEYHAKLSCTLNLNFH